MDRIIITVKITQRVPKGQGFTKRQLQYALKTAMPWFTGELEFVCDDFINLSDAKAQILS